MSHETNSDEEEKQENERAPSLLSLPLLLSSNNDDNHVDIVMESDMNSSSNVISNYNESGSYQYVYRP